MQLGAAYHEDKAGPDDSLERTIREKEMTEALNVYVKALATLFQTTTTSVHVVQYIFTALFFLGPRNVDKTQGFLAHERAVWMRLCVI